MEIRAFTAIATMTFREAVRSRIYYGLVLFFFGLIMLSAVLSELTLGWEVRVVADLSLASCSMAAILMAALLSIGTVSREIEQRTALPVLAKPISRWDFILGKYIGVLAVVTANLVPMLAAATVMIALYSHAGPFQYPLGDYLQVVAMMWLKAALVAAFALFFAAMASSTVAFIGTFGMTVAGQLSGGMHEMLSRSDSDGLRTAGSALHFLVPDLGALSGLPSLVNEVPLDPTGTAWATVYALCYVAVLLVTTAVSFSRRDLA